MNNKLLTILKYEFINDFKLNKTKNNQKVNGDTVKKRVRIYFFIALLIVFYVSMYFGMFYNSYEPNGLVDYVVPMFAMITSFLCFVYSIRLTEAVLFKAKDYDLLTSLPIKPSTILAGKIIYLLGINYYMSLLIMVPAAVLMMQRQPVGIIYVLLNVLIALIIPLIPLVLGSAVAILIGFISTKFKRSNIVTIILSIVFIAYCMYLPSIFSESTAASTTAAEFDSVLKIYYPIYMIKDMLVNPNILNIIEYVMLSIVIFAVFTLIIGKTYVKINQKLSEKYKVGRYIEKKYVKRKPVYMMTSKEVKKIFSIPMYLMNTCFGAGMMIFAAIYMLFVSDETIIEMFSEIEGKVDIFSILIICCIFLLSISPTTSSSISLEGKNLWIYKTTPAKSKDILTSKVLSNLVIFIPSLIFAAVVFYIRLRFGLVKLAYLIILPLLMATFSSINGVLVNLKYPWLDFDSEVAVVKRSSAVLISMIVPVLINMCILAVFILLNNIDLSVAICSAIALALVLLSYRRMITWGTKRFEELE